MKIKGVMPVLVPEEECRRREEGIYQDAGLRSDTKIEFIRIPKGPGYLSYYTECLDSDYNVFLEASKAEKEGYDAVQPDCVFDPAAKALKEVLNIPVVAPLECSLHMASLLGRECSILINEEEMIKFVEDKVREYGFEHKVASVRVTGITFEELGFITGKRDKEAIDRKLITVGKKAIEEDGADVIIYA
ncbi:MAG: aspartate/glutamate racemase family protein [Pseudomonadota bacterium]